MIAAKEMAMPSQIRPTRPEVNDRFPMLGFTIRPDKNARRFEIAVAADPNLFRPDAKGRRNYSNFYSTRAQGPMIVARDEAVYVLPPEILGGFVGQQKLYYALATFGDDGSSKPQMSALPTDGSPYIDLRGFTGRSLRRIPVLPDCQRAAGATATQTRSSNGLAIGPPPRWSKFPLKR